MTAEPPRVERRPEVTIPDQAYWWWLRDPVDEHADRRRVPTREQVEGKWPAHTRAVFVIAAALGSWTLLLAGVIVFLRHVVPALGS